eukprot:TRINITY_DN985_c0_g1_i3.p1 TRINITY_DN985_c0_g1~~TRINITY_DN985_c0_g1_i3.p1  ORF type:complete len:136 (-),score=43.68 TRINITY_DN985_c0_g1_i3:255-662(-)
MKKPTNGSLFMVPLPPQQQQQSSSSNGLPLVMQKSTTSSSSDDLLQEYGIDFAKLGVNSQSYVNNNKSHNNNNGGLDLLSDLDPLKPIGESNAVSSLLPNSHSWVNRQTLAPPPPPMAPPRTSAAIRKQNWTTFE